MTAGRPNESVIVVRAARTVPCASFATNLNVRGPHRWGSMGGMIAHSAICPVRIGKEREVEILHRNAVSRRTTLISGSAGVGKSRLSREAAVIAADLGMVNLVGHCTPESALAFEPFVSAVRRRIRTMDVVALTDLFGGTASLSGALFPDVALSVGTPMELPAQPDLFAAIWQLLFRLGGDTGGMLLVEDLHWADTDTLELLTFLARESADLGMWIVGTYRGDEINRRHPLTQILADLARERYFEEIQLTPLGREELGVMTRAIFDNFDVGEEFVDALYERTGGNPFFAEELLKVLIERGDFYLHAGDWIRKDLSVIEMPTTVRETLLSRTRSMDPQSSELLHLAALDSDRIDITALAAAVGCSIDRVEAMIAEGLSLQLLAERREVAGPTYMFRHALTREALSDEMVGPQRRHGHLSLAAGIVEAHRDELDSCAAALADHYLGGGDQAMAIRWNRRAALAAASSFAAHEASRRFELVLGLMSPNDPERLNVLLEAVTSTTDNLGSTDAADVKLSFGFASEARHLAQSLGDATAQAQAIDALAVHALRAGDTPGAVNLRREALDLVHGRDDVLEAWLYARLCAVLTRTDQVEEATSRLPEAMALAQRAGNHGALSQLHVIAMMNGSFGPAFTKSLEAALAEARLAGSPRAEHSLYQTAGYVSLWYGDFELSRRCFLRSIEVGERLFPHDGYTRAGYVWLLSLMGRYEEIAGPLEHCQRSEDVPTRIVALTGCYEASERRGSKDAPEILEDLWRMSIGTGESQRSVPALAARARWRLLTEGAQRAAADFREVLDKTVSGRGRGSHWLFSPDFAGKLLEDEDVVELTSWAEAISTVTANDPHPHNQAANELVQGYLAIASSEWISAHESLDRALVLYESLPCPARLAETHLAYGELSGRLGNDDGARESAEMASRIAKSIGAEALVERARISIERASVPTRLATVLFTDIVRSTERMSEVGDRAWRSLLDRHDVLVRRELDRFQGQEVNTTGDGFVAAFDSPAQAIRCAQALRESLGLLGIVIRAGLHTGECQVVGNDLRGLAVHLAARVSGVAEGQEVLVTSTVKDLVAGLGFTFVDRGTPELKGVTGDWRLFSV